MPSPDGLQAGQQLAESPGSLVDGGWRLRVVPASLGLGEGLLFPAP